MNIIQRVVPYHRSQIRFSRKTANHIETVIGVIALLLAGVALLAWISLPVWILTHHYHWSSFTTFAFCLVYTAISVSIIVGLMIANDM